MDVRKPGGGYVFAARHCHVNNAQQIMRPDSCFEVLFSLGAKLVSGRVSALMRRQPKQASHDIIKPELCSKTAALTPALCKRSLVISTPPHLHRHRSLGPQDHRTVISLGPSQQDSLLNTTAAPALQESNTLPSHLVPSFAGTLILRCDSPPSIHLR
jgi:hypothetical protein